MSVAPSKRRLTADEYQRMGLVGMLSEDDRVELIDGDVVAMTPIGARHNACVNGAMRALVRAAGPEHGSFQGRDQCARGQSIAPQLLPSCAVGVNVFLIE